MDAKEYIVRQIRWMRRQIDATILGTTAAQYSWTPPGELNPIGVVFLHLLVSEDGYIQDVILGKPRLWESENWQERIGASAPARGQGWEQARGENHALESAFEYQNVVRAETDAYLEQLTAEELDRRVMFIGGERRVADVLVSLVVHGLGHAGEIAALKGMQGIKGLPF